jgi:hypothetical protein
MLRLNLGSSSSIEYRRVIIPKQIPTPLSIGSDTPFQNRRLSGIPRSLLAGAPQAEGGRCAHSDVALRRLRRLFSWIQHGQIPRTACSLVGRPCCRDLKTEFPWRSGLEWRYSAAFSGGMLENRGSAASRTGCSGRIAALSGLLNCRKAEDGRWPESAFS